MYMQLQSGDAGLPQPKTRAPARNIKTDPQPRTSNTTLLYTLNSKPNPSTMNPQPYTLNPQPPKSTLWGLCLEPHKTSNPSTLNNQG